MDLLEEQRRGEKAALLLRDPLIEEAFRVLGETYVAGWSNSDPSDVDQREQCYQMLKSLEAFRRHLESVVQTGKMASQQIDAARQKH